MPPVGAIARTHDQGPIETTKKDRISHRFGPPLPGGPRRIQMRIATDKDRDAHALRRPKRLMKALEPPAHNEYSIELASAQPPADFRRVNAREAIQRWRDRSVAQKFIGITGEQIDIPIKSDAKSGLRLIVRCCAVAVEDREVQPRCQCAEERRVILYRVGCDNGEAHGMSTDRVVLLRSAFKDIRKLARDCMRCERRVRRRVDLAKRARI